MLYFYHTPVFIQKLFPNNIWRKDTLDKIIYLTFDDGPTPEVTDWVIKLLATYNAKATFFCLGKNISLYPDIIQRLIADAHLIANHGYSHFNGWWTKNKDYIIDVKKTQELIEKRTSRKELFYRPPYGKLGYYQSKALKNKGYKIVLWDVLSGDFNPKLSANSAINKIIKHVKPGSIIVFHDSKKAYNNLQIILPKLLAIWEKEGYIFEVLPTNI